MPKGKEGLSGEDQEFEWEQFKASEPPMASYRVSCWQADRLVNWKGKWPRAL